MSFNSIMIEKWTISGYYTKNFQQNNHALYNIGVRYSPIEKGSAEFLMMNIEPLMKELF